MDKILKVSDLTVFMKPGVVPVYDINLELSPGEVVGILGPNGMGKTTILEAIAGFVKVDRGKILFEGRDITNLKPHERVALGIAYCPERGGLIRSLTVEENILLAAREKDPKKIFSELEELFPRIVSFRKRVVRTLSGGEQKMLLVSCAFVKRPKLLLLDEPSAGLAPKIRNEICDYLSKLKEKGITMIIVEQDPSVVSKISDRVYIMEWGRLREFDNSKLEDKDRLIREFFSVRK